MGKALPVKMDYVGVMLRPISSSVCWGACTFILSTIGRMTLRRQASKMALGKMIFAVLPSVTVSIV
jgi:hypothetical protein